MSLSEAAPGPQHILPVPVGRSGCPINMTMEVLGDRWSLVVLRDVVFGGRRHFRELLGGSLERIASNILADRLAKLVAAGLLTRHPDPSHKQKIEYRLTEPAIELVPILVRLGAWGARWLPTTPELRIRATMLDEGGDELVATFLDELRQDHLRGHRPADGGVLARLTAEQQAQRAHRSS